MQIIPLMAGTSLLQLVRTPCLQVLANLNFTLTVRSSYMKTSNTSGTTESGAGLGIVFAAAVLLGIILHTWRQQPRYRRVNNF
jgi:hypothetical protein